jgi:hypothetical protein
MQFLLGYFPTLPASFACRKGFAQNPISDRIFAMLVPPGLFTSRFNQQPSSESRFAPYQVFRTSLRLLLVPFRCAQLVLSATPTPVMPVKTIKDPS